VGFILPTPHMIGQEGRGEGRTAPEPPSPLPLPLDSCLNICKIPL